MKKVTHLHKQWMKDPKFRKEYKALEDEFDLASTLIAARTHAGLSQRELAERMKTSQSFVARLESGTVTPTWETLNRYARATGTRLRIELEHENV